jgi:phosphoglycerate dehydrogenase-like enzyme
VVTDSGDRLQPGIALLRSQGVDVRVLAGGSAETKVMAARDADALMVGIEPLTAAEIESIAAADHLRFVIRCGVGHEIVDVAAATRHGIQVANVPDYCTAEVADHTMALLLAAARRLPYFFSSWRSGWHGSETGISIPRLSETTLGIVGCGRIGRAVATRARAFGIRVLANDPVPAPSVENVSLRDLLQASDFSSLHCPLTAQTRHLMCDETFALMKVGSILINTGRGGLVDHAALLRGLARERPTMAALDVLEDEPNPDLAQPLLAHPRVLVTPHVAYYSVASRHELSLKAAQNILSFLRGESPGNVVNPQVAANSLG